mmetsp:Transcript_6332/g.6543  ORF Transcript_6332/g.6543 Transcript_6332/m.6543 type:complete len:401 (+) Transcript_6332:26-1228(+)
MAPKKKLSAGAGDEKVTNDETAKKAKFNKDEERTIFGRDVISLSPLLDEPYCKVISWNVAGLRALIRNHPTILSDLASEHQPDVICLQETKLQKEHCDEHKDILAGYSSYWICSEIKKGYSGVVVFIKQELVSDDIIPKKSSKSASLLQLWGKRKNEGSKEIKANASKVSESSSTPQILTSSTSLSQNTSALTNKKVVNITYDLNNTKLDGEGRTITVEFDTFYLVMCYVPNSGMDLKRLDYRIEEWDPYLRDYLKRLNKSKPVVLGGDLNVGHLDVDIYNVTAKHIVKQAGLTPQERASFSTLLSTGFTDVFRYYHGDAKGQFTYWSQRMRNRDTNRGLRLDYFVCSNDMLPTPSDATEAETKSSQTATVIDSYILYDFGKSCSDHCPIVLIVRPCVSV